MCILASTPWQSILAPPPPLCSSSLSNPFPRYFKCIRFLVPLHMALPLFGKSLLVLQDQDQISSLRAKLQFSLTGTSTQDSFRLRFALAFMGAVNHSVSRGLIYASVSSTRKPRTHGALGWVSSQHGAFFLALSGRPIDHRGLNIREEGP